MDRYASLTFFSLSDEGDGEWGKVGCSRKWKWNDGSWPVGIMVGFRFFFMTHNCYLLLQYIGSIEYWNCLFGQQHKDSYSPSNVELFIFPTHIMKT